MGSHDGRIPRTLTETAAQSLNIKLQILEVRRRDDLAGVFETARKEQAEALNVFSSPFLAWSRETAKSLGLAMSPSILRADEVIE